MKYPILYVFLSVFLNLPAAAEPLLWEQMQQPDWNNAKVQALDQHGISTDTQKLILEMCKKDLEKTESFYVQLGSNTLRFDRISDRNQIRQNCFAKVGETFCQQDAMVAFINQCAEAKLAEAKIQSELAKQSF